MMRTPLEIINDILNEKIKSLQKSQQFHNFQGLFQLAEWDRMTWGEYQKILDRINNEVQTTIQGNGSLQ